MNDTNKDQASEQRADTIWTEAQRLLGEIKQFRSQAEDHCKVAETSRKNADSEGLFAINAKKVCEEHATAISQLKGNVESEANAIQNNKQKSDEFLAALTTAKATIDADTKMVGERRKEADLAASSIKTAKTELETIFEHLKKSDDISIGHEAQVAKLAEDLELLMKRVNSLLPGATSAGLASSFNAQKLRFAKPQRRWLNTFIWCIVGLVAVALPSFMAALGIPILGHSADATPTEIWRGLMLRMPIVIPLVWLAIYAGRYYMLSLRLEEEYAYKEAVSTAFEGYKREMTDIEAGEATNPSPLTKLCTNILAAIAERPGRIYEGKHSDITILNESHGAAQEITELAKKKIARSDA